MEEAVEAAVNHAEKGDIVSLSPASASFGLARYSMKEENVCTVMRIFMGEIYTITT